MPFFLKPFNAGRPRVAKLLESQGDIRIPRTGILPREWQWNCFSNAPVPEGNWGRPSKEGECHARSTSAHVAPIGASESGRKLRPPATGVVVPGGGGAVPMAAGAHPPPL